MIPPSQNFLAVEENKKALLTAYVVTHLSHHLRNSSHNLYIAGGFDHADRVVHICCDGTTDVSQLYCSHDEADNICTY